MLSATADVIRLATDADSAALAWLASRDSQPPLEGPTLVGEVAGSLAAALSLRDGRLIADPFRPTPPIAAHLRIRAESLAAQRRTPSLATRLRAAVTARAPRLV
jgi:hypothetical protein